MNRTGLVLFVDDDALFRTAAAAHLAKDGIGAVLAGSLAEARGSLGLSLDAVILDQRLPDGMGMQLVTELRAAGSHAPVLMVTGHPELADAVEALRLGIVDYVAKPVELEELRLAVLQALRTATFDRVERAQRREEQRTGVGRVVSEDAAFAQALATLERAADSAAPVLITGETGSGKSHLARALHHRSARREQPFVAVNCAALPDALVEAELFGSEKGAFTGAVSARPGLFELAHRGTLLLDEIGELPLGAQAKLLSVLEDGEVRRVGAARPRPVDARVIAATNLELARAMHEGRFRRDLYYRLDVLRIDLPPLRERPDQLRALIEHFLRALADGREARLAPGEEERLAAYAWPGNARELRNVMERALLLHPSSALRPSSFLHSRDLPPPSSDRTDDERLDAVERAHILRVLGRHAGQRARAAQALGISIATLRRKLHLYGVPPG